MVCYTFDETIDNTFDQMYYRSKIWVKNKYNKFNAQNAYIFWHASMLILL